MTIGELIAELVQIGLKEGNIHVLPGDGAEKVYPSFMGLRVAAFDSGSKAVVIECPRSDIDTIKRDAQKESVTYLIGVAQKTDGAEVWRALLGEIYANLEREG